MTKLFGNHSLSEQEEMVRETLVSIVAYIEKQPWLETNLVAMGKSHAEYGVEDHMYEWTVECMLGARRRDENVPAWGNALLHITDVMRAAGARS